MAAGFFYSGWTALSVGGITGNHAGIIEACTKNIDEIQASNLLWSERVNRQCIDPVIWNASYADARITQVTAIDPRLVWGLAAENVARLLPNVNMIGFGWRNDRRSATNFDKVA